MDPQPLLSQSKPSHSAAPNPTLCAHSINSAVPTASDHVISSDQCRAPQPLAGDRNANDLALNPLGSADEDDVKMAMSDRRETADSTLFTATSGTVGAVDGDPTFDDLEFLHDFLEYESKRPFFESNFFQCNARNICILCVLGVALCVGGYAVYALYWDSYIEGHWLSLLKAASIPLICIAFTYGHIALALWMTFWPTQFWPTPALQFGSGPFAGYGIGWQGIVPMKAVKMAQIAVDLMVPDVVRMEDVVAKIDPVRVSGIIEPALLEILKILIPRVAAKQAPIGWALLPEPMKQKMISVAIEDSHVSVENMIADISQNIESMFDLTAFISNALRADKQLLSQIFIRCGRKELIFIRNFGGVMGLVFGLMQMVRSHSTSYTLSLSLSC